MTGQSLSSVRIVEVGPRDGLQNVPDSVPTSTKLELIHRLEGTGLSTIELTSVVSPRVIPQLADCRDVLRDERVKKMDGKDLRLPVLVPNVKGLDIAIQHGVKDIAVFISATEGFSKANINCSVEQGIERARTVASLALKSNIAVRGYVSCIFADPYDGPTQPASVLRCVKELLDAGCYEVSLGDTLGIGSPSTVRSLLTYLLSNGIPREKLAGHFHDTYGQALANVWEAYNCGLQVFDSSIAGLGGCPFAPGAKGNLASEDLVYMFHNAGIETGVDLSKLVETGVWISDQLSKTYDSRAGTALAGKNNLLLSGKNKPSMDHSLQSDFTKETGRLQVQHPGGNLKRDLDQSKNGNASIAPVNLDVTSAVTDASKDPQNHASLSREMDTSSARERALEMGAHHLQKAIQPAMLSFSD
ncbi:hypothetical protein N7523_006350 [Penicillium sp. IBT 18751x]|nr:hypothetical protein N7523_006350 [Penicillium sp. IBT 18751x]